MSSDDRRGGRDVGEGDKRRSFTKFIRRTSKMMHPKSSETGVTGGSSAETSSAASPAGPAIRRPASPPPPAVPPKEDKSVPARRPVPTTAVVRAPSPEVIRTTPLNAAHHYRLQEEKARALFAKYNMTLEAGDWQRARRTTSNEWVEKKTRLRVQRQCHHCQVTFGSDKVCQNCTHTRCKKCPRYPDKSLRDHTKFPHAVAVDPDPRYQVERKEKSVLTIEGKRGQELVRKHPVHRVRRTCHRCDALFVGKATQCATCQHMRCPKCPREPPKEKKWPNGYPGDTPETFPLAERHYKTVRHRVRWECDQCNAFFGSHDKACPKCQHARCDQCLRHPPKKVKKDPDPEVVKALEEKLQNLVVAPAAA